MRRIFAILLSVLLMVPVLTACGNRDRIDLALALPLQKLSGVIAGVFVGVGTGDMEHGLQAGLGNLQGGLKIFPNIPDAGGLAQPDAVLEMEEQAAVVQVDSTYNGLIIDVATSTALCNAAKSGVDVRIITPHIPDKRYVFEVTRAHYPPLLEAGVQIYGHGPDGISLQHDGAVLPVAEAIPDVDVFICQIDPSGTPAPPTQTPRRSTSPWETLPFHGCWRSWKGQKNIFF